MIFGDVAIRESMDGPKMKDDGDLSRMECSVGIFGLFFGGDKKTCL